MAGAFKGASVGSLETLIAELGAAISGGVDGNQVADDLFNTSTVLLREPSLRRVLTDFSLESSAKSNLVRQMFDGKLGAAALDLVASAAGQRWASTRDLAEALEQLGVVAVVKAAELAGEADALEDQLFSFGQLVSTHHELRDALSDPARSADDKRTLLRALLDGKATAGTIRLAEQAVSGSHHTVAVAIATYQKVAAAQRNRLVALVRVARPLGDGEAERLATSLAAQYGRPVHLNMVVEPALIGGVRVEIGDDVIDGTVVSRLDNARRLAG
jgi:F-type H+-transporting ATPase subunit delta